MNVFFELKFLSLSFFLKLTIKCGSIRLKPKKKSELNKVVDNLTNVLQIQLFIEEKD